MKNYIYLTLAMILVGTSVVVGKLTTESMPVFLSTFLGLLIASILFLPVVILDRSFKYIGKKDMLYLALQALLGTVLYRILLFFALRFIDSSYVSILSALQPAIISLFALITLKEKQSQKQIIGIAVAVIGLMITYFSNQINISLSSGTIIGTSLILLSLIGEASLTIFAKKINKNVTPIAVSGVVIILSAIMMLPLGLIDVVRIGFVDLTISNLLLLSYYGVVLSFISYILWFKGLEGVKAGIAGIFTALIPISGIFFSAIFLQDFPNVYELIGGTLIIISIILVVYKHEN